MLLRIVELVVELLVEKSLIVGGQVVAIPMVVLGHQAGWEDAREQAWAIRVLDKHH